MVDDNGEVITSPEGIVDNITQFYFELLGSGSSVLQGIDLEVVRKGLILSSREGLSLVVPIRCEEIDSALYSIHSQKSPSMDGFSTFFFKKCWHILRYDMYDACFNLFKFCKLHGGLNVTVVSLIPKVVNASHVAQFHPISCCNVLYKVVSKVLTITLQKVVANVIDQAQSGFIPGRKILDNVLLGSEIIKGYGRKNLSPSLLGV